MNTLSLLLYISDVLYSLVGLLTLSIPVGWVLYIVFVSIRWFWCIDIWYTDSEYTKKLKQEAQKKPMLPDRKWFWITGVLVLFLTIVPSKDTFYLIVASEAGETIVNTPEAKELMKDVREVLDAQLEKLKK
jgi:hypothetical protein